MYPDISIVIPFFDTPVDKLEKCFNSVCRALYDGIEVIVIDDGSKDKVSSSYAEKYCLEHKMFRYCRASNRGVSSARNMGTEMARGRYVMYVDSDDEITPWSLQEAHDLLETNYDVIYARTKFIYSEDDKDGSKAFGILSEVEKDEVQRLNLLGQVKKGVLAETGSGVIKIGPFARLVKTEIAKKVLFPVGIRVSEDTLWNISVADKASSLAVVESTWYWYWKIGDSATRGFHNGAVDDALKVNRTLAAIVCCMEVKPAKGLIASRMLGEATRAVRIDLASEKCELTFRQKKDELKRLLNDKEALPYIAPGSLMRVSLKLLIKRFVLSSGLACLLFRK